MNRIYILLLTILQFNNVVLGQIITGSVSFDNYDQPAIGAAVLVKETNIGTCTDFNGNYKLQLDSTHKTLCFSYIGFKTFEVNVENKTVINVSLVNEPEAIDDFILTSYIRPRKRPIFVSVNGQVDTISKGNNKVQILKVEKNWMDTTIHSDWVKFVFENINYPDSAIENYLNGNIYAKFIIDTAGNLAELEIIKGIEKSLDQEVYETLLSMPKWTQTDLRKFTLGKGKKYSGIFILPVKFRIEKE